MPIDVDIIQQITIPELIHSLAEYTQVGVQPAQDARPHSLPCRSTSLSEYRKISSALSSP
jgi:hypothetical protein